MDGDESLITRHPLPFPPVYTPAQVAAIAAAITEAASDPAATVDRSGTVLQDPQGRRWTLFNPLAYLLSCERCVAVDGSVWDTVPALSPGIVGSWPEDEAGRILHLVRDVSLAGEFAFGAQWAPVWLGAPWCTVAELEHGSMPSHAAMLRAA